MFVLFENSNEDVIDITIYNKCQGTPIQILIFPYPFNGLVLRPRSQRGAIFGLPEYGPDLALPPVK